MISTRSFTFFVGWGQSRFFFPAEWNVSKTAFEPETLTIHAKALPLIYPDDIQPDTTHLHVGIIWSAIRQLYTMKIHYGRKCIPCRTFQDNSKTILLIMGSDMTLFYPPPPLTTLMLLDEKKNTGLIF